MKKILIIIFCSSTFALTACNEKPTDVKTNETTSNTIPNPIVPTILINLTHNNIADIKSDFESIQSVMSNMAAESNQIEQKIEQVMKNKDAAAIIEMKNLLADFTVKMNQNLDDLTLKSNEVYIVRSKLKQLNRLHADLAIIELDPAPDQNKQAMLTQQVEKKQQELQEQMMQLQQLINSPQ